MDVTAEIMSVRLKEQEAWKSFCVKNGREFSIKYTRRVKWKHLCTNYDTELIKFGVCHNFVENCLKSSCKKWLGQRL